MMLESLWHQLKIRFPFSDLQIEVLHNLHLTPTQLHPNGWGFLQTFEVFCWAQGWHCSSTLFLYIFGLYRGPKKKNWVPLRHRSGIPQLFVPYEESFKAHRDIYVKVIPQTKDCTPFWMGKNKQPFFPLYWTKDHYQRSLSLKELEIGFLEEEDQQTFRNLCAFVEQGGYPTIVRM
jgi:hypothetical protein